jgi:hypothetical protein
MSDNAVALPDHIGSVINMIARAASDPAVDIAKLEALMAMQERVIAKQNAQLFASAMADAQAEMAPVVKDKTNTHIGNRYARLEAIDNAIRPIYAAHGFSVRYRCENATPGSVRVVCILSHRAGHIEESSIEAPLDASGSGGKTNKTGVQAVGSTITYLRRYALTMAFNVVMENDSDDDDGEASRRTAARQAPRVDPKAVAWKDAVIAEFGQLQSEKSIAAYWKKLQAQYDAMRANWPEMADEIDAAGQAALDRVRLAAADGPTGDKEFDAGLPQSADAAP